MYTPYEQYCVLQEARGQYRTLSAQNESNSALIDFSSNDYLSLSHHPALLDAAYQAGLMFGVGATGSRLVSGNQSIFETLECKIAHDKKTESAIIFNSGFQANSTALASLLDARVLGKKPLVFFDRYNHSSLYQAVFLSQAEMIRFEHQDLAHLKTLLEKFRTTNRPYFIVSETIFGMDGDQVDLKTLVELSKQYQAFLYLDEAHSTGIFGASGYGLSTDYLLGDIPHVVMGTFSKALGCAGGYIACSASVKNYLMNKCPGFIYATAPSPMVMGAVDRAWDLVRTYGAQRKELFEKADHLRSALKKKGFDCGDSTTHIIPIFIDEEDRTMQAKQVLLNHGILVSAIRPPTVPPKTSRLRIALQINHTWEDIDRLIRVMESI